MDKITELLIKHKNNLDMLLDVTDALNEAADALSVEVWIEGAQWGVSCSAAQQKSGVADSIKENIELKTLEGLSKMWA